MAANAGQIILEFGNLFCAGILAGVEFVVCFGVRTPLRVLDVLPQIQVRQALIRVMRLVVPPVFVLTALSGIGVAVVGVVLSVVIAV